MITLRAARRAFAAVAAATLLSCLAVTPGHAGVAAITRGPYLQNGTTTSVVIRWRTDVATNSRVQYGKSPGNLGDSVHDPVETTEHEIVLSELDPATRYYYAVGTTVDVLAGNDVAHFFTTCPPSGTRGKLRVWVIGDSGTANEDARRVRDSYLSGLGLLGTDVWLMLGDNAYNTGTDSQYQAAVFDMYPGLLRTTLLWPTRGNHDYLRSGPGNDYYDFFTLPTSGEAGGLASGTEAYYSFNYANVHFVCLDSHESDRTPTGPMLTWLEQDLAANKQDWTIAYWHHPPYSKGSHDSDRRSDSSGRLFDMRENALPILEAGGVDLVLSGHSHSYERSFLLDGHYDVSGTLEGSMILDDGDGRVVGDGPYRKPGPGPVPRVGAVYGVVGCSGKISGGSLDHPIMVTSQNRLGSLLLDIEDARLDAIFIDDSLSIRDTFRIEKDQAVAAPIVPEAALGLRLSRAEPNPSRETTRFRYALPEAGPTELTLFDVRGRVVARLVSGERPAGRHAVSWDGRAGGGEVVAPGVYFAVLEFGGQMRTRRVVRTR